MRVYATDTAKVVLRLSRVPFIHSQLVLSPSDSKPIERDAGHDRPFAPAKGAIAAPHFLKTVAELYLESNCSAMATTVLDLSDNAHAPSSREVEAPARGGRSRAEIQTVHGPLQQGAVSLDLPLPAIICAGGLQ